MAGKVFEYPIMMGKVLKYPTMTKKEGDFKLKVVEGEFKDSEIIVLLGKPGTGKTTISPIAGVRTPDTVEGGSLSRYPVSYKAQNMIHNLRPPCFVRDLLRDKIRDSYMQPLFVSEVMEPLQIDQLMDQYLPHLSDDEFRRLLICLCLGKSANFCLIEEPCANLNPEQRNVVLRVIKRFIHLSKKTAVVVADDFTMAEFLADKVIVFEGTPSVDCVANSPQSWNSFVSGGQMVWD